MNFDTTMAEYSNHFEKVLNFINIYQELINCHLVDFITDKLWDKCIPEKLKSELECINIIDDIWTGSNMSLELDNFIQLTKSLSLESCSAVIHVDDLPNLLPQFLNKEQLIKNKLIYSKFELMNNKKSYEVQVLGKLIAQMALCTSSLVIDAGAGKAYLSTYLSEHFDIPVLAIDLSQVCHKGAVIRQEKIQRKKQLLTKVYKIYITNLQNPTRSNL